MGHAAVRIHPSRRNSPWGTAAGGFPLKTRNVPAQKVTVYLEKAHRFQAAARAAHVRKEWDPAVSAAVHSLINAVDAVSIRLLGKRSASEDHEDALALLLEARSLPAEDMDRVAKHVKALLSLKHVAEYEDRLCEENDSARALQNLERALPILERWAGASPSTP